MTFTPNETATILAALRYWQADLEETGMPPLTQFFGCDFRPLTVEEIDALCERINGDSP